MHIKRITGIKRLHAHTRVTPDKCLRPPDVAHRPLQLRLLVYLYPGSGDRLPPERWVAVWKVVEAFHESRV